MADKDKKEKDEADSRRRMVIDSIVEGRKMEAYSEHRTKEMHACWFCDQICYRKKPMKNIGTRWICISAIRHDGRKHVLGQRRNVVVLH